MRRLYLLRHGEVAYFDAQGKPVDPWATKLTDAGCTMVDEVAATLNEANVDLIVASAVPRALESADIIARRTGITPQVDADFNELAPGDLASVARLELEKTILHAYLDAPNDGARFFGGESFAAFATRVDRGLQRLLGEPGWTVGVVVTHDPVIRCIIANVLSLGLAGLRFFEHDPASVTVIDFIEDPDGLMQPVIRLVNGGRGAVPVAGPQETALAQFYRRYRAATDPD
jgi:probable phosphoglycerate mutase